MRIYHKVSWIIDIPFITIIKILSLFRMYRLNELKEISTKLLSMLKISQQSQKYIQNNFLYFTSVFFIMFIKTSNLIPSILITRMN